MAQKLELPGPGGFVHLNGGGVLFGAKDGRPLYVSKVEIEDDIELTREMEEKRGDD